MSLSLLENELLKTLSFFEPMSLDLIYLDLDRSFVEENPNLTIDDLELSLKSLINQKKVKKIKIDKSNLYIRNYPKKSLLHRFLKKFSILKTKR